MVWKKRLRMAWILVLVFFLLCLPVSAKQQMIVAYNQNAAPYCFLDDEGNSDGLFVDIMDWIGDRLNRDIIYEPYPSFSACYDALRQGRANVILGGVTNQGNTDGFQYTSELLSTTLCVVAPVEKAEALSGQSRYTGCTAVYEYGTISSMSLSKIGTSICISKGSQSDVLETLINGTADIALMDYSSYLYLLRAYGVEDQYTILRRHISASSYAMLVKLEDDELCNALDDSLAQLHASGVYNDYLEKWVLSEDDGVNSEVLRKIWMWFGIIAATALSIIAIISIINRTLKRSVAQKTAELEKANRELDARLLQLENEIRLRRSIMEQARSGMISFDKEGHVILVNRAAQAIIGREARAKDQILDLPVFGELLKMMMAQKMGPQQMSSGIPEVMELVENDTVKKYRCLLTLRGASEEDGLLMTVEDVTYEERKKQEAFEKEKTLHLSRLVASIAHEIKNPLMSIRTAATLLRDNGGDPEVQEAISQFLPGEADRINQLVEGLIQYAKPTKGKKVRVDVSALVQETFYLLEIASRKQNIRYEARLEDGLLIFADRDKIKQSLINIIINGIDSMESRLLQEPDRTLCMRIETRYDAPFVVVSITDEGEGMSQEKIRYASQPFFTTKETGTGLGLALVQQYMNDNGGTLEIESVVDSHTTMRLKFRRHEEDE